VKSATEDASLGISQASLVEDLRSLRERVQFVHEQIESDALVEEYVDGREIYVGVLGNARLVTLPPWEMDFGTSSNAESRIATRKVKWDRKYQAKHGIKTGKAHALSDEQRRQLSRLAKRTYRALYMSGFARMDFRLCNDGRIVLLEANANPNLSKCEDLADAAKAAGLSYSALVERIVRLGLAYMPEWRMFERRAPVPPPATRTPDRRRSRNGGRRSRTAGRS
jgi:D-alanine-D-alanine ligase